MGYPIFVTKRGNALVPTSRAAQLAIDKMKPGARYKITPKQPRNEKQHRMFWAFATYVAEALNDGPTIAQWTAEDVKNDLLVATGRAHFRPMSRMERMRQGSKSANDPILKIVDHIRALLAPLAECETPIVATTACLIHDALDKIANAEPVAFVARPKSISFSAMDGDEFSAFMDEAMTFVRDHLAPWIEGSDHWQEIEKILAASWLLPTEREGDDGPGQ